MLRFHRALVAIGSVEVANATNIAQMGDRRASLDRQTLQRFEERFLTLFRRRRLDPPVSLQVPHLKAAGMASDSEQDTICGAENTEDHYMLWPRWVELKELFSRSSMRTFLAELDESVKILCDLQPIVRSVIKPPHQAVRRLGTERVTELARAYEQGIPTTELTRRYGLGKGTVLRLLREQGVVLRHQPLDAQSLAEAITLYQAGWSLARIGTRMQRQPTVIRDVLERSGVARRDSHA